MCDNYRNISLLNTGHRIYPRIFNKRLKSISHALLLEKQNGFMKGRSCMDSTVDSLKSAKVLTEAFADYRILQIIENSSVYIFFFFHQSMHL